MIMESLNSKKGSPPKQVGFFILGFDRMLTCVAVE